MFVGTSDALQRNLTELDKTHVVQRTFPPPPARGAFRRPLSQAWGYDHPSPGCRPGPLRTPQREMSLSGAGERHSARSWQGTDIGELGSARSRAILGSPKLTPGSRPWTPP